MKKLLYILVFAFSLFFIIYALNQSEISLYKEWVVLMVWFILIKLLGKKLFKDEKEIEAEEDEESEEIEDDEEDEEEWDSDEK